MPRRAVSIILLDHIGFIKDNIINMPANKIKLCILRKFELIVR